MKTEIVAIEEVRQKVEMKIGDMYRFIDSGRTFIFIGGLNPVLYASDLSIAEVSYADITLNLRGFNIKRLPGGTKLIITQD